MMLIKPEFLAVWALEGIVVEDEKKTLLTSIHHRNWLDKQEEPVVKASQELEYLFKRSIYIVE